MKIPQELDFFSNFWGTFYMLIMLQDPSSNGMGNAGFIICFGDVFGDFF